LKGYARQTTKTMENKGGMKMMSNESRGQEVRHLQGIIKGNWQIGPHT
jgi:hypothetical protein